MHIKMVEGKLFKRGIYTCLSTCSFIYNSRELLALLVSQDAAAPSINLSKYRIKRVWSLCCWSRTGSRSLGVPRCMVIAGKNITRLTVN